MSSLLDLQRRFRAALLAGKEAPEEVLDGAVAAAARVAIYRNNVLGNLTGALRLNYPAVERLVGPDFFGAAAARFITVAPPRSADLHQYGSAFAKFLAAFEPARYLAYLPDVARLEWAVNCALHAPLAPALAVGALPATAMERAEDLRFVAHPSLTLLRLGHPARAIWEAVLKEDATQRARCLAAIELTAAGEDLAVLRGAEGLELIRMAPPGREFAHALVEGRTLAEALEGLGGEDATALLGGFLAQGFFSGWRLPAAGTCTHEG